MIEHFKRDYPIDLGLLFDKLDEIIDEINNLKKKDSPATPSKKKRIVKRWIILSSGREWAYSGLLSSRY